MSPFGTGGRERRITLRLLAYWEKLRRDRLMPVEDDINPEDIQDLWDSCFLIHVKDLEKPDYNYTYLGEAIARAYYNGITDDKFGMMSPHAEAHADCYTKVIDTGKPLVGEGEFRNLHNDLVKYRQCLLPLGENGRIDAIFGGMHFKIFS